MLNAYYFSHFLKTVFLWLTYSLFQLVACISCVYEPTPQLLQHNILFYWTWYNANLSLTTLFCCMLWFFKWPCSIGMYLLWNCMIWTIWYYDPRIYILYSAAICIFNFIYNHYYWWDFLLQCVKMIPVSCTKPCWRQTWQQKLDSLHWMHLVCTVSISRIICLLLREIILSWGKCLTYTSHFCKLVSQKLCSAMCLRHSVLISTTFLLLCFKVSVTLDFILWI